MLRVELTQWGFAVLLAASGQEAEEYAACAVAHLVVLDAKLHLGAYEGCARIRRRPGYASRPIVLTANELSPKIRAVAATAGATLVLRKPYSVSNLVSAIRPFLPPDDLLVTHCAKPPGLSARQWVREPTMTPQSGGGSALTRDGLLLPIVRGRGVSIPFIGKRAPA